MWTHYAGQSVNIPETSRAGFPMSIFIRKPVRLWSRSVASLELTPSCQMWVDWVCSLCLALRGFL